MEIKKTEKRTADYTWTESTICDICKKVHKGSGWKKETFEVLETEVRIKTGSSYPEGGSGEDMHFDICPKCFMEKLIPWLKGMGWDW